MAFKGPMWEHNVTLRADTAPWEFQGRRTVCRERSEQLRGKGGDSEHGLGAYDVRGSPSHDVRGWPSWWGDGIHTQAAVLRVACVALYAWPLGAGEGGCGAGKAVSLLLHRLRSLLTHPPQSPLPV